jgi:ABC-2 type transport system permease protein
MSARRVRAVVSRIVALFRRDHRTLALIVVVPVVILLLLGWVIRDQQVPDTRVAVVAEGPAGALFADALADAGAESGIEVSAADTEDAARALLRDREVDLVVVIPATLGSGDATLRLVTLGLNPGEDGTHVGRFQQALVEAIRAALPSPVAGSIPDVEVSTIHGRGEGDLLDSFAPVFVGYFAYFFVFLLTGVSFLRERIGGTLERLLATPITRAEIVLGYSIGFGIFATIQVAIVLAFTLMRVDVPAIGPLPSFAIGLDVPSAGSPLLAYVIALVLGLGAVSLGIFLSTFARTELQVIQFIPVVIVPQGLLGGIFWPVETLPDVLQPLARIMPVTYAIEALREVMIAGGDLATRTVQVDLVVLAAIAALFVVLAARTIRREIA